MDIAPGAVEQLRKTQALRLRRNEASASQVTLACFDACDASAWPSLPGSFGVLIDKSTTDGLLCDTRRGAARVRSIYALAGRLLCPTAVVAVVLEKLFYHTDLIPYSTIFFPSPSVVRVRGPLACFSLSESGDYISNCYGQLRSSFELSWSQLISMVWTRNPEST